MTAASDPLIGQWLGEHQLTEVLGVGQLGIIYACRHGSLGSERACKVLHAALAQDQSFVERFIERAQQASRLHHPHRVDVFDIGQLEDGRVFYIMERVHGRTLAQRLADGPLPWVEVLEIGRQLCATLAAAHAQGVHGNELAAERVFLVEDPQPTGPASVKLREPTEPRELRLPLLDRRGLLGLHPAGDPRYLAPEHIRGEPVDPRVDLYALGALLFEISTGRPPFVGATDGAILRGHLRRPVPALDPAVARGFPEGFGAVLQRTLAKRPQDRYESATALEADLVRLGRGERTVAESRLPVALERRSRRAVWLAAAVLSCGTAAGAAYLTLQRSTREPSGSERLGESLDLPALRRQALGTIREGLQADDVTLRRQAVAAVARGRDPRLRDLIEPRLEDADPQVAQLAAETLGRIGARGSLPALQRCARGPQPLRVRVACAAALDVLGSPLGQPLLRQALREGDEATRLLAALQLTEHGDAAARELVRGRLGADPPSPDSLALLERLLLRDDPAARARAQALLAARPSGAEQRAAQLRVAAALLPLQDERARTELVTATEGSGPEQLLAAHLLCMAEDLYGQPVLRRVAAERDRPLAELVLATTGLGGCGDKTDMARLARALEQPTLAELRQAQAGALLRLCASDPTLLGEQSVAIALNDIHDEDPTWRSAAAAALGESRQEQAVPVLGRVLREDAEPTVREQAARSLGRTQTAKALPELGSAVEDPSRAVRVTAMRSIAEVAERLRKSGAPPIERAVRDGLRTRLVARTARGDEGERVAAAGTLIRLGDDSQRALVREGLTARDPETQRLAIREAGDDPELQKSGLSALLSHPDPAVRLEAAKTLALAGQREAVPALRQALLASGEGALAAYGLLQRLGEQVAPPAGWESLFSRAPAATRLTLIESASLLPVDLGLQLLSRASRDADHTVRRRVVEVLGELQLGPQRSAGLLLLRRMQGDADAVVRALATALIARRGSEPARRSVAPERGPDGAPRGEPAADLGAVPPQDGGATAADPPPERIATAAAPEEHPPATAASTDEASERGQADLARLLQAGLLAVEHKQMDKAERLLVKANAACARPHGADKVTCTEQAFALAYGLARVYAAQGQDADAMTEFEKAKKLGKKSGADPAARSAVSRASRRLAKGLGRVAIAKPVHGRCSFHSVWMPPGVHSISLPDDTLSVRVRAGQTVKVGSCR
ncbi:MAG: HEAT repeat domain-containing protein [Polyangia bacterium]